MPGPAHAAFGTIRPCERKLRSSCLASVAIALLLAQSARGEPFSGADSLGPSAFRSPEDGGPRRLSVPADGGLGLYDAPSVDAVLIHRVVNGAILENLGCSRVGDRTWCKVRPFRGGPRGYASVEHLVPAPGPDGIVPTGVDESRLRIRSGDFDASGSAACSQDRGQMPGECKVVVARSGGGDATLRATFPNGFARTLRFENGEFVSANPTMSGAGTDTDWRVENGNHVIRVDDQSYELPHDLIFGN
jgi:hypothetical protein